MNAAGLRMRYRVPAKRGMRVVIDGEPGRIVSFRGQYLGVRLDHTPNRTVRAHPRWRVTYLDDAGNVLMEADE